MSSMDFRLRELRNKEKKSYKWFVLDSNNKILSPGYRTQYVAIHLSGKFKLYKSEKLIIKKFEVYRNGKIKNENSFWICR